MSFRPEQVKQFVKNLRRGVGDGWNWMTPRVREALVAEAALGVIAGQASETVPVDAVAALWFDMLVEAGLREPREEKA